MARKTKLLLWAFSFGILFFPFICVCDDSDDAPEFTGDVSIEDLNIIEQKPDFSQYVLRGDLDYEKLLDLLCAIESPLWKSTQIPKGRDPLYLLPYKITALEYGGISTSLFFNMTNKMQVSSDSLLDVKIISKQKVTDFLNELLKSDDGLEITAQELSSIVPLLQKITLQEIKAGFFLQGGFVKGPFNIQVNTLCQVAERNFWLNKRERAEASSIIQKKFPGGSLDDKELYRLTYGFGDTRVKCGLNTLNMTDFVVDFGFEGIVPTSRISSKHHMTTVVDINLDEDNEIIKETLVNLLRGTRDLLLEPKLGNGGHFGVGCYIESKIGLFNNLANMWLRFSYNKLFANDEYRLIMFNNATGRLDKQEVIDLFITDPTAGKELISLFAREFIFPSSFKTSVNPGGIFNAIVSISFDVKKMNIALGYDFYAQQQERIEKVYSSSVQMSELRIEDAQIPDIYQHKIFSEALYTKQYKRSKVGLGLGGDVTAHSKNLGYDWTVYLKGTASF
ncbi:MAG: hypothetical protein ABH827_01955 [bacterium]